MPVRPCVWIGGRGCRFAFAFLLVLLREQHETRASLSGDGERRGLQSLAVDHGLGLKLGTHSEIGEGGATVRLGLLGSHRGLATRSGHRGHDIDPTAALDSEPRPTRTVTVPTGKSPTIRGRAAMACASPSCAGGCAKAVPAKSSKAASDHHLILPSPGRTEAAPVVLLR